MHQVGSHLGWTGRDANAVGKGACDPIETCGCRRWPTNFEGLLSRYDNYAGPSISPTAIGQITHYPDIAKGTDGPLSIIRAAYAKQILAAAGVVDNVRLEAALSATRREDFLGAGPWWMLRRFQDYVTTPDADPVYLYTDDLVGILPNGESTMGNRRCMRTSFTRLHRPQANTSCISEPAPAITPPSWLTLLGHQVGLPE